MAEVLHVPYAHLVFTLPHSLNALYGVHPRWVVDALFACAAQALAEFAANPKWMGWPTASPLSARCCIRGPRSCRCTDAGRCPCCAAGTLAGRASAFARTGRGGAGAGRVQGAALMRAFTAPCRCNLMRTRAPVRACALHGGGAGQTTRSFTTKRPPHGSARPWASTWWRHRCVSPP